MDELIQELYIDLQEPVKGTPFALHLFSATLQTRQYINLRELII